VCHRERGERMTARRLRRGEVRVKRKVKTCRTRKTGVGGVGGVGGVSVVEVMGEVVVELNLFLGVADRTADRGPLAFVRERERERDGIRMGVGGGVKEGHDITLQFIVLYNLYNCTGICTQKLRGARTTVQFVEKGHDITLQLYNCTVVGIARKSRL